jgi:hypothetical protein
VCTLARRHLLCVRCFIHVCDSGVILGHHVLAFKHTGSGCFAGVGGCDTVELAIETDIGGNW